MNKRAAICLLALVTTIPSLAHCKIAVYDIVMSKAIVQFGELDSVLAIRSDTSAKEPSYVASFDSLEFTWKVIKSQMEYDFYNGSGTPVVLVWDSMSAVDTRGFLIDLIPSGVNLNDDMTASPKKVGPMKRFHGWFFTMTRQGRYSGIGNPILPLRDDDNRMGLFAETVPLMKGKNFKYTMAIKRGENLERYTFTFYVRNAYIK